MTSLQHQQSPLQQRDLLQSGIEATLHHLNYKAQALALLRKPPNPCGNFVWAQRNYWEPSHHGKDRQISTRAHGAQYSLRTPNGNQVPGPGRFCGQIN
jgi:hypothetical protein